MAVPTDLRTAVPLSGFIAAYFYFKPDIPPEMIVFSFIMWFCCFILDVKITISNAKLIRHEKNLIFPIIFYKFGKKISPIIQFMIEITTILLIVSLFDGKLDLSSTSMVSLAFGIAHLDGYVSNIRTIKKIMKRRQTT